MTSVFLNIKMSDIKTNDMIFFNNNFRLTNKKGKKQKQNKNKKIYKYFKIQKIRYLRNLNKV